MNQETLIPNTQRTREQLQAMGRKGGLASAKSRMEKADVRKALQALMELENGDAQTGAEVIALKLFEMAKEGDLQAIKEINNRLYGLPKESIETTVNAPKEPVPVGLQAIYAKIREIRLAEISHEEVCALVNRLPIKERLPELTPEQVLAVSRMKDQH